MNVSSANNSLTMLQRKIRNILTPSAGIRLARHCQVTPLLIEYFLTLSAGVLGLDQRPRFHDYVTRERRQSYEYRGDMIGGGEVPPGGGVVHYDVPPEYGVQGYKYTTLNQHSVIVDPRTHHIVEIIN